MGTSLENLYVWIMGLKIWPAFILIVLTQNCHNTEQREFITEIGLSLRIKQKTDQSLTEPVCTGLHKFLNGRIFYLCNPFTRTVQILSQIACSTVCCSKTWTVSRVPCKRNADLCKFLSVQKFVRTFVNGLQLLYPKSKVLICFQHFIIIKPDFWKRQQKLPPCKVANTEKINWAKSAAIAFFLLVLSSSLLSLFLLS